MPFLDFAGNSLSTARDLDNPVATRATFTVVDALDGASDPQDYYRFSCNGAIALQLTGLSDDANLQLLDSNGSVLRQSNNTGVTGDQLTVRSPGTYYLRISAPDSRVVTPYQLSFTNLVANYVRAGSSLDVGWEWRTLTPETLATRSRDRTTPQILWQYGNRQQITARSLGDNAPSPAEGVLLLSPSDGWQLAATGLWDYRNLRAVAPSGGGTIGTSSISIFRNLETGANQVGIGSGSVYLALPTVPDLNWQIGGVGDFNGDGSFDLIWHNQVTGENLFWLSRRPSPTLDPNFGSEIDAYPSYFVDGYWTPTTSQSLLDQFTAVRTQALGDLNWNLVGTGDFNRDQQTDLVWRNRVTGQNLLWLMNGTTPVNGIEILGLDRIWELATTGDLNQDGTTDLVWHNPTSGQNVMWAMDGTTPIAGINLASDPNSASASDPQWHLRGVTTLFDEAIDPDEVYQAPYYGQLMSPVAATDMSVGTLDGLATVSNRVNLINPYDDIVFTLNTSSNLSISLENLEAPVKIYLFRENPSALQTGELWIETQISELQNPTPQQPINSATNLLSLTSALAPTTVGLEPGSYRIRVVRTTQSTNYSLNLLASPNPAQSLSRYTYTYYANGVDQSGGYYSGYGYAPLGTYTPGIYELPSANDPGNSAGRYQIHRVETVTGSPSQLGRVYTGYTSATAEPSPNDDYAPTSIIYGRNGLGSERTYQRSQA